MAGQLDEKYELTFHGVDYIVSMCVDSQASALRMAIEQKDDLKRWQGNFSSTYVEDIASKTGNFKKFPVFVEMLRTALGNQSDTVFVDLLTFADLQMLKSQHSKAKAGSSTAAANHSKGSSNKRYLILTYAVEFDRVHYPLPFQFDANPDQRALRATIHRLRRELKEARQVSGGSGDLVLENQQLRRQLRSALMSTDGPATVNGDTIHPKEFALLQQRYDQLKLEAQQKLHMARNERNALLEEIDALQNDQSHGSMRAELQKAKRAVAEQKRKYSALLTKYKALQTSHKLEIVDLENAIARLKSGAKVGARSRSRGKVASSGYGQRNRRTKSPASAGSRRSTGSYASNTRSSASRLTKKNVQQHRKRSTSRPRSKSRSSSRGRFDPTAYVEARKAKIEAARRARSASPGRSVGSRGSQRSRTSSASRTSRASRKSRGTTGSRKTAQSRRRRSNSATSRASRNSRVRGTAGKSGSRALRGRPTSTGGRRNAPQRYGDAVLDKENSVQPNVIASAGVQRFAAKRTTATANAEEFGRAPTVRNEFGDSATSSPVVQDSTPTQPVSSFDWQQIGRPNGAPSHTVDSFAAKYTAPSSTQGPNIMDGVSASPLADTTPEAGMADIDRRLNAIQAFLRAAKNK